MKVEREEIFKKVWDLFGFKALTRLNQIKKKYGETGETLNRKRKKCRRMWDMEKLEGIGSGVTYPPIWLMLNGSPQHRVHFTPNIIDFL